jgi:hypothetical protein
VNKEELERRTKEFALRVVRFVAALPKNKVTDVLGYQLLKAATSIGANYREANRAVSRNFGFSIANFGFGAPRSGSCHQCLEGEFEMGVIALISLPRNFCRKPLFGTTLGTF